MRALAILLLTFGAFAQSIEVRFGADTPAPERSGYPKPGAEYRQPVAVNARIMQGNGGAFSHQDTSGKFAWD